MNLKIFHKTFVLSLDKRGRAGEDLAKLTRSLGATTEVLLVGDAKIKKPKSYFRIDSDKPSNWVGNRQTYNYTQCWFKLLEKAKEQHLRNFLFVEDDAMFSPTFADDFSRLMEEFITKVNDWDMLYLGSNQLKEDSLWGYKGMKTHKVADGILRSARARDMHAVAVNNTMYEPLLALKNEKWLPDNPSFDETVAHALHHKYKVYAFKPSLVKQKPGFSYNKGAYDDRTSSW